MIGTNIFHNLFYQKHLLTIEFSIMALTSTELKLIGD